MPEPSSLHVCGLRENNANIEVIGAHFFFRQPFLEKDTSFGCKSTRSRICKYLFLERIHFSGVESAPKYGSAFFFFDNQFFDNHFWRKDNGHIFRLSKVHPIRQ